MRFLDILRSPDSVNLRSELGWKTMELSRNGYCCGDCEVMTEIENGRLCVSVTAKTTEPCTIVLRWQEETGEKICVMGDHWERGYGDLGWMPMQPDRALPWYFLTTDRDATHGYGVKTGPGALCCWFLDGGCISLMLDVRCGGKGVQLNGRTLLAAEIVSRKGIAQESPFAAAQAFCRMLCTTPRLPEFSVYGGNNWYYAYGNSSQNDIMKDSRLISELAFMIIDDGWQISHGCEMSCTADTWMPHPDKFPDMEKLAAEMKSVGVRPGLWFRPTITTRATPDSWRLHNPHIVGKTVEGEILDPSIPDVLEEIGRYMDRFRQWGFELIKHDFTTYDCLARWGSKFDFHITDDGWSFYDRSKTTAEILSSLYAVIRKHADKMLIIGCNTISHIAAGFFEIQRTGDDTSGLQWERTRRMGVNTLAFRMPQHGAFYAVDADCAAITPNIDWALARQWLDVLSESGTPLFVSADPQSMGPEQCLAVKEAFAAASCKRNNSEPLDWLDTFTPRIWKSEELIKKYDWVDKSHLEKCAGYLE